MAKESKLTAARVRELLDYDPSTGIFTWRVKRRGRPDGWKPAGTQAGAIWAANGYRHICIDGLSYRCARLAFVWMNGQWPRWQMDHKNRDHADDRWSNVREATPSQQHGNQINSNNALGLKGVCYEADRRKYKAYIEFGGRSINLGRFDTAEEAQKVYAAAAKKYFGEFARTKK